MKRFVALLLSGFGLAAWLRWRGGRPPEPELSPADELRARLSEARAAEDEPAAPVDQPAADPQERRRAVHERARQQLDELG
jgi:hypothetical protein